MRLIYLCTIMMALVLSNAYMVFGEFMPVTKGSSEKDSMRMVTGDINGDGKTDLIFLKQDPARGLEVQVNFSIGDGRFRTVKTVLGNKLAVLLDIITGDVNGDGKADLIIPQLDLIPGLTVEINFSNGNGTFKSIRTVLGDKF